MPSAVRETGRRSVGNRKECRRARLCEFPGSMSPGVVWGLRPQRTYQGEASSARIAEEPKATIAILPMLLKLHQQNRSSPEFFSGKDLLLYIHLFTYHMARANSASTSSARTGATRSKALRASWMAFSTSTLRTAKRS